ncbi:MAG: hypothetical protein VXZ38_04040 [Planctomycetota bacterium]|nr:hypothetical protein [Planctomycetota bacterium]
MKSFGLRLGMGAITVVLAAYIAIVSRNGDTENVSEWTAESTTDQSPASPLGTEMDADSLDSGWLQPPKVDLAEGSSLFPSNPEQPDARSLVPDNALIPSAPQSSVSQGQVRLVQHDEQTEDGGVSTAFTSDAAAALTEQKNSSSRLSEVSESQGDAPDSDWLLPDSTVESPAVASDSPSVPKVEGSGFQLPSATGDTETSVPNESGGTILAVPSIPAGPNTAANESNALREMDPSLSGAFAEDVANGSIGVSNELDFVGDPVPNPVVTSPEIAGDMPSVEENHLREGFGSANALRAEGDPADLEFTFSDESSDEPMISASSADASTALTAEESSGIGSGLAGATLGDPSVDPSPVQPGTMRLPNVQDLNEVVGNGLRSPDLDVSSSVVGTGSDLVPSPEISSTGITSASSMGSSPVGTLPSVGLTELAASSGSATASDSSLSSPIGAGLGADSSSLTLEPAAQAPSFAEAVSPAVTGGVTSNVLGNSLGSGPVATMDSPGARRLEGAQTPSVVIQKRAPSEVRVGKAASFVVNVRNVGQADALNVQVFDQVPAGMRFVEASPSAKQLGEQLLWELGSMAAGEERTITMQLVPEQEGELGSVARVSFEAAASVRTLSTKPELKIVQRVPEQGVLIGQQLEIEIEVSNPGTGSANGVVLQEDVPEGLEHPRGRQLDNAMGDLAPGEVRRQVLRLRAVAPGIVENTIRLVSDDGLEAEHTVAVQVISPDLRVQLNGPSRRFLERPATYQLLVANKGTADATNLEIAVHLDRGFTFVSTENEGYYDPNRHAVFWSLASLPAGAQGMVPLTLLPVEIGEQAIRIEADGDLGIRFQGERTMSVEGFAELSFAVSNSGGPIEVGAETEYEVTVTNTGSMPDKNVQIQLQLPAGLELLSASSDAGTDGQGLVAFQPITQLQPNQTVNQTIRVRGLSAGVHLVRAVVVSEQSAVPVSKEESTRVYADQ